MSDDEKSARNAGPACGAYLGDNDGTCPQLTCVRAKGHEPPCDNVRGDEVAPPRRHDDVDCCGFCGRLFPQITKVGEGQSTHCRCDGTFIVAMFDPYQCPEATHKTPREAPPPATPTPGKAGEP